MRRFVVGSVIMVAILTLSAMLVPMVAASRDGGGQTSSPALPPLGQAAESSDKTPYIGVAIVTPDGGPGDGVGRGRRR